MSSRTKYPGKPLIALPDRPSRLIISAVEVTFKIRSHPTHIDERTNLRVVPTILRKYDVVADIETISAQ